MIKVCVDTPLLYAPQYYPNLLLHWLVLLYLVSSAAVLTGLADLGEVTIVGQDGTGTLGHTKTLKVALHKETDGNLQLAAREGLDAVDVGDVDGLGGETLEEVLHKGAHNHHGTAGEGVFLAHGTAGTVYVVVPAVLILTEVRLTVLASPSTLLGSLVGSSSALAASGS